MPLNIKIENFEGPFDLLLHLIKKNKMDIYNVSIFEITEQYLEYIRFMEEFDLEIASEFILIAATLLEIKSRSLLPKEKNEEDDDENINPKEELMRKLLEYNKFKLAANFLRSKEDPTAIVFTKKGEIIEPEVKEPTAEELLKGISMLSLYNLFQKLMQDYNSKMNKDNVIKAEMYVDSYKIEDKITLIRTKVITESKMYFSDLKMDCCCRLEVVVTFLALLELIKNREVKIIQKSNFDDIYIERIETVGEV
ncbi:MAG: segregation/condensation protein A [Clostridiaceae bacterium]